MRASQPPPVKRHGLSRRTLLIGAGGVLGSGAAMSPLLAGCVAAGPPLDLGRYTLVFEDRFTTLDVTPWGPGSRWIAHTPWNGDFGDAAFADPEPGFPFTTSAMGGLRIEARKGPDGKWRSGLLASADAHGVGFGLQYGYFEMRAKLPKGDGVWPAFWLDSMIPKEQNDPSVEIDVLEFYGQFPEYYHSTVMVWPHDNPQGVRKTAKKFRVEPGSLSDTWHTYGVSVDKEWIVMYRDRQETWRTPTPPEHRHKLLILLDLALGGGWPIDKTPSPSVMDVDYVRAFEPK